jgi:nucleoside-diphosphate-sugar epimerase
MGSAFVTGGSGFVGRNLIAALKGRGWTVRALSRAPSTDAAITSAGALPVRGDLEDTAALRRGMAGCDAVFHCAAVVVDWGPIEEFERVNVEGTRRVIEAARAAAVPVLVQCSSESVLIGGPPMVGVDETWPYPERPFGPYAITKGKAERLVRDADAPDFRTVVVRPATIWGKGDTSVLPKLAEAVRTRAFMWIKGGRYRKSMSHVANVCEGLLLAAEKGRGGEVYFVTDGEPMMFREFLTRMMATQGLDAEKCPAIPYGVAWAACLATEAFWVLARRPGQPPRRRTALHLVGEEIVLRDDKARRELGYRNRMTVEQGLAEMAAR